MENVKAPDFERRPAGDGIFWSQDAKSDVTPQVVSPGCFVTVGYKGVTVRVKVDAVNNDQDITGLVDGFDTKGGAHPDGIVVGERVRLAEDQILSCGCVAVS